MEDHFHVFHGHAMGGLAAAQNVGFQLGFAARTFDQAVKLGDLP
jgi:hypothetical protein